MARKLQTGLALVAGMGALCLGIVTGVGAQAPEAAMGEKGEPAEPPRPPGMLLVPAGSFTMGRDGPGDESPARRITLAAFFIDTHEVTNAEYAAFCEAAGRDLPEFWGMDRYRSGPAFPQHPVVGVSWREASAYAQWAGKRLPTEAEWEYAARGGLEGKSYATGDSIDSSMANFAAHGPSSGCVAVGSYPPNGFGLYDMTGNVSEWVADRYDGTYYARSPSTNPPGPASGKFRVIRGGGWHTGPFCSRVSFRNALPANWRDINVGFRCARDAPQAPARQ